jgi:hypothetical protein
MRSEERATQYSYSLSHSMSHSVSHSAAGRLARVLRIREALFGATFAVRQKHQSLSHVMLECYVIWLSLGKPISRSGLVYSAVSFSQSEGPPFQGKRHHNCYARPCHAIIQYLEFAMRVITLDNIVETREAIVQIEDTVINVDKTSPQE